MRALSFRERSEKKQLKLPRQRRAIPWRLALERVLGKGDFFDELERIQQSDLAGSSRSPAAKSDRRNV